MERVEFAEFFLKILSDLQCSFLPRGRNGVSLITPGHPMTPQDALLDLKDTSKYLCLVIFIPPAYEVYSFCLFCLYVCVCVCLLTFFLSKISRKLLDLGL